MHRLHSLCPFPRSSQTRVDHHIKRPLSSLRGMFADAQAYETALAQGDILVYEVFEIKRPEAAGELQLGVPVLHPGKVGAGFFMTKGHFHSVLDTAEMYYCFSAKASWSWRRRKGKLQ